MLNIDYLERLAAERQKEIERELSRRTLTRQAARKPRPVRDTSSSLRFSIGLLLIRLGARLAA